jgi:leader peptidase (prepilin peptidase) / N-methyltransferase
LIEPQLLWLLAAPVLGAIAGSFTATILIRWPKGQSALTGRSRCDACGTGLKPYELVPFLSYVVQRGRCRGCGARVDRRHLAVELAAAAIGLAAVVAHPLPLALATALLGWWLLLIAALDLEEQWLPDLLTLPLIPLGLLTAWLGLGPPLQERAAGAAIGWAVLSLIALLYRRLRGREGLGGGDPKLLGAIGAWVGALQLPYILVGAGMLGLAAVALMKLKGEEVTPATRLPLGTLMAVAAWPVWLVIAA